MKNILYKESLHLNDFWSEKGILDYISFYIGKMFYVILMESLEKGVLEIIRQGVGVAYSLGSGEEISLEEFDKRIQEVVPLSLSNPFHWAFFNNENMINSPFHLLNTPKGKLNVYRNGSPVSEYEMKEHICEKYGTLLSERYSKLQARETA